jgi:thiol-disulfide isomerase/thioredoxin
VDLTIALTIAAALVAAATVIGLAWQRLRGRAVSVPDGLLLRPADVDSTEPFGNAATLLQFSTEFCSACPATHRLLAQVAEENEGVRHVDIDLTSRTDLARRFDILQTPTTLILDGAGRVRARIGGAPRRHELHIQLNNLIGGAHVNT